MIQIYNYFNPSRMTNTYILWKKNSRKAIAIDPVEVDINLFEIFESNFLQLETVLFTHVIDFESAVRKLPRVYPHVRMYGGTSLRSDNGQCMQIEDKETLILDDFIIKSFAFTAHHSDSLMFQIDNYLFSGDILSAGTITDEEDTYFTGIIVSRLRESILILPEELFIFPLKGPSSTIGLEKQCNLAFQDLHP